MIELDVFPTRFFQFDINPEETFNVLNEVLSIKDRLELVSMAQSDQYIGNYQTDFFSPTELKNFETVINKIVAPNFTKNNLKFKMKMYWTARYKKYGFHTMHNHIFHFFDNVNYSGIFYLGDNGSTEFFNVSPTSVNTKFLVESVLGKIILFPSTIPHCYSPILECENERYIIAFNCEIKMQ